jgi:hypothetical protein
MKTLFYTPEEIAAKKKLKNILIICSCLIAVAALSAIVTLLANQTM